MTQDGLNIQKIIGKQKGWKVKQYILSLSIIIIKKKMALEVRKNENNPELDSLVVERKWSTWTMYSHSDGDVEVCCETDRGDTSLYLSQDELKQVLEFLQSKVK